MSALRIGITIGLNHAGETLWNNGIKQNAAFLALALAHCPKVASVALVNTTAVPITPELPWDLQRWPTLAFDDARDAVDVLIELGGQINADQTDHLKRRGARLVSYCCGFEYIHAMESVLFGRPLWGLNLFVNQRYDAIWMVPQVAQLNGSYFSTLRRRPAQVVPFVWDPVFLEQRARTLPEGGRYRPRSGARRISVMEPNLDMVKFCLYPALIADAAYRQRPEAIALLQVTNAERIARESQEFIALMHHMDLVRQHKAVFLGTHETPAFLAENTDVVVSHQWENALNYFYLEVCWQGYPLIHNAQLCADMGYYYDGHDLDAGCARLLEAIDTHDAQAAPWRERQRALIARYRPGHPEVTARYAGLLGALMQREPI